MKKILFGIIALIILIGGSGFAWYKVTYGGGTYYVQITKDGKEKQETANGQKFSRFTYNIDSYQKDGKEKKVEFTAGHNLRKEAYLKLTVNSVKGVTSWEEVKKAEVPKEALKKLSLIHI